MRTRLIALAAGLGLAGAAAAQAPVVIDGHVPFADDRSIQRKVREECTQLNTQLPQFVLEFAPASNVEVRVGDASADSGRVLRMVITQAISQGNAFIGHAKSSSVRGDLYEDGRHVAGFDATRNSMGGAFAGYKGSCSVLGRTMRAMGRDIAQWLANPVDGAELGDR